MGTLNVVPKLQQPKWETEVGREATDEDYHSGELASRIIGTHGSADFLGESKGIERGFHTQLVGNDGQHRLPPFAARERSASLRGAMHKHLGRSAQL